MREVAERAAGALRWVRSGFYNLRLTWKILLPYAALLLVLGAVGAFVGTRSIANRAEQNLEQELARLSVTADAHLRDRALFLSESALVGANIDGIPEAVREGDTARLRELLASLVGSRLDLDLVALVDDQGIGLVEITRADDEIAVDAGSRWSEHGFVADVLAGVDMGRRSIGIVPVGARTMVVTAAPIDAEGEIGGAVLAGIDTLRLASELAERTGGFGALYDPRGMVVSAAGDFGDTASSPPAETQDGVPARRIEPAPGGEITVLYAPLELQGTRLGTFALAVPTDEFLGGIAGDGLRLAFLLTLGVGAVVGIGGALSRVILRQLRPLVDTNRALGAGDLTARTEVLGTDELGELAAGLNQMAEQLQASRSELERKVAERTEELQRLYRELVEVNRQRTDTFSSIVHELRGHLFVIQGYAELLLDDTYQPGSRRWRREFGETITAEVDALSKRVDEILDLGKVEAGRMDLHFQDVHPVEVLAELRPTIAGLASAAGIAVEIAPLEPLPPVQADRERLGQVMMNLVSNAVKYTPAGGRIRIFGESRGDMVAVSVSDTGVGIAPKLGNRIFEPFYQVPGTKSQRGEASSGLGLAIARRLVEAHGGTIWYESQPGEGTMFTFTVRAAKPRRRRARAKTPTVRA